MKNLAIILFLATSAIPGTGCAQEDEVQFDNPIDTLTAVAQPVGGYPKLLKEFQHLIDQGDTLGPWYWMALNIIRFRVDIYGNVDSITTINHMANPIHRKIVNELRNTKWVSTQEKGKRVHSYIWLEGRLKFNKEVYRKYQSWSKWMESRQVKD